jgi:hypothetical protein
MRKAEAASVDVPKANLVISVWPETRVFQRGPRKGLVLLGAGVSDFPAFDCHSPNIR